MTEQHRPQHASKERGCLAQAFRVAWLVIGTLSGAGIGAGLVALATGIGWWMVAGAIVGGGLGFAFAWWIRLSDVIVHLFADPI